MLVTEKLRSEAVARKWVVSEKESREWVISSKSFWFQAVTIPPEAPTDGRKIRDWRGAGRSESFLKCGISSSLDSCRQTIEGKREVRTRLISAHLSV